MRTVLSLTAATLLSCGLAAHADTLYDFNGALASGITFDGTITYSPTGGVLNGATYTNVNVAFSDGTKINTAVTSIPGSGEHEFTTGPYYNGTSVNLVTTNYELGTDSDTVCTLTQHCADETSIGIGPAPFRSVSSLDGQQLEQAYIGVAPTASPTSVTPEPSSIALLGTGLLGVAGVLRRRIV